MCKCCETYDSTWVVFVSRAEQPEFSSLSDAVRYVESLITEGDGISDFEIDREDRVVYLYYHDIDSGNF